MTKLTDIPGASEALPKKKHIDYPCDKDNVFLQAKREVIGEIESVHLEVDVEAMAKEIKIGITDVDDFEKLMANGKVRKLFMECATHLSTTTPKWARLVRK